MHLQPNRNYVSNDDVQTPVALARRIVAHFQPRGRVLEPCAGDGSFLRALRACTRSFDLQLSPFNSLPASRVTWCEIKRGRDFFAWQEKVDWVITNPPWSQFREFLRHAMTVADEVVFLVTINHLWTRARIRDLTTAGFGLKEIVMVDMPASFPPLGFQLGAVQMSRGWQGAVTLTDWRSHARREAGGERRGDLRRKAEKLKCRKAEMEARGKPKLEGGGSGQRAAEKDRRRARTRAKGALPSQWMSGGELAALTPQEHLQLILQAA